ncbi:MAG: hypothetical protein VCE75_10000 [Alphaproteobacteria bacterium]
MNRRRPIVQFRAAPAQAEKSIFIQLSCRTHQARAYIFASSISAGDIFAGLPRLGGAVPVGNE